MDGRLVVSRDRERRVSFCDGTLLSLRKYAVGIPLDGMFIFFYGAAFFESYNKVLFYIWMDALN